MVSQSDIFPDLEQVRLVGHSQVRQIHTTDKGFCSFERVLLCGSVGLRTRSSCVSMSAGTVGVPYHHGL